MNLFGRLPDELIVIILKYLPASDIIACRGTCGILRRVSDTLIEKININPRYRRINGMVHGIVYYKCRRYTTWARYINNCKNGKSIYKQGIDTWIIGCRNDQAHGLTQHIQYGVVRESYQYDNGSMTSICIHNITSKEGGIYDITYQISNTRILNQCHIYKHYGHSYTDKAPLKYIADRLTSRLPYNNSIFSLGIDHVIFKIWIILNCFDLDCQQRYIDKLISVGSNIRLIN